MRLELAPDELRPIIAATVAEMLRQRGELDSKLGTRLGFTEPEAAAALGIASHRLRDCRLRGEITARKVGKGYVYSRDSLVRYLESA